MQISNKDLYILTGIVFVGCAQVQAYLKGSSDAKLTLQVFWT